MNNLSLTALSVALNKFPEITSTADSLLVLRAQYFPELSNLVSKASQTLCVQSFRPYYENLSAKTIPCSDQIPESGEYDLVILMPTQQRDENLYLMASALSLLKQGGLLISSIQNNLGAGRFEQHQKDLFGNIESYSKNKCRVFWSKKDHPSVDLQKQWLKLGEPKIIEGTSLVSYIGVYGADKIDRGSALLLRSIDQALYGRVADLGCGYGYLSYDLLSRFGEIKEMSLYDGESIALRAARINLARFESGLKINYYWADCTRRIDSELYNFIVMNPPFHIGKVTDPEIGIRFINTAYDLLEAKGTLFVVSNAKLPYEKVISDRFSSCKKIIESDGFKVIKASK